MTVLKQKNSNGQWEEIQLSANDPRLGKLSDLTTNKKISMVDAVNEVNAKLENKKSIFRGPADPSSVATTGDLWFDTSMQPPEDTQYNGLKQEVDQLKLEVANKVTKNVQYINVKDLGAKGDGVTDDTNAFKAAWSLALTLDRTVFAPAGDYIITDTLSGEPITIFGSGTGVTCLIFQNMSGKDGISFTTTTKVGVIGAVANLSIIAKGQHGRNAIKTADNSNLYNIYRVRYHFHDLEFRGFNKVSIPSGFNYDYGWECYIDLGDSWGAYIENIDAVGTYNVAADPSTQPDQLFLRMQSNGNILTARVNKITTHGIKKGFEIGNKCFFMIDQCDIAHSYEGIYTNGTTIYSEGRITDTLVNSQLRCIHLATRSWTAISNVAVARHDAGYNHGLDWYGFYLDDVNKSWLTNLRSQVNSSSFTGTKYGFYFKDCDGISAIGLTPGINLDYGIVNDNTAAGIFENTNFQINTGTAAWAFLNNSRYIRIGLYENHASVPDFYVDSNTNRNNIKIVSTTSLPE